MEKYVLYKPIVLMCYYVVTTRGASVGGVAIYGILGTLCWQIIYVILVVLGDLLMVTGTIPIFLPFCQQCPVCFCVWLLTLCIFTFLKSKIQGWDWRHDKCGQRSRLKCQVFSVPEGQKHRWPKPGFMLTQKKYRGDSYSP